MGKSKRLGKGGDVIRRAAPLAPGNPDFDAEERGEAILSKRTKKRKSRNGDEIEFVDEGTSSKILRQAREQIREEEDANPQERRPSSNSISLLTSDDVTAPWDSDEEGLQEDGDDYEPQQIDPSSERAFNEFLAIGANSGTRTLADIIQEAIDKKKQMVDDKLSVKSVETRELDPRMVEMLHGVRDVLKTYTSGRLPKIFKIIPKLVNWEQVIQVTQPECWSSAAVFQGTRIFVSNLGPKMCQRYLHYVLLPRVRDDIQENKKLNYHLYQALFKALFKPAAFFKGVLIPLCESRTCTLREATIIGSVLTKCKVPMLHAAAAMLKLAEMQYSGANSLFLRVLLEKKYTLPFRVLDGLVFHFCAFEHDRRELPVLWHQALLSMVQYYKADISTDQRESLLKLIHMKSHYVISDLVRRELQKAESRDLEDQMPVDD